jgi:hypothetical protein
MTGPRPHLLRASVAGEAEPPIRVTVRRRVTLLDSLGAPITDELQSIEVRGPANLSNDATPLH